MNDVFTLADDLGPLKVIHVHEPGIGLKGVLVAGLQPQQQVRIPTAGRVACTSIS